MKKEIEVILNVKPYKIKAFALSDIVSMTCATCKNRLIYLKGNIYRCECAEWDFDKEINGVPDDAVIVVKS